MRCPNCGYRIDPKRTDKQRNTFHALCSAYSRVAGQGAAYVKILFKYRHGIWIPFYVDEFGKAHFPAGLPEWPGRPIELFKGTPDHKWTYMKSEAAYTKDEERELIAGAISECYDIGANIEWLKEAV